MKLKSAMLKMSTDYITQSVAMREPRVLSVMASSPQPAGSAPLGRDHAYET
jgi:hypothetical protein